MPNEETKEVKKEPDEIDKKFDEARGIKFEVNYRVVRFSDHEDLSSKNPLTMQICPMEETITNDERGEDDETATTKPLEREK